MNNTTELIPSISIANLLNQRDAMMQRLTEVNRLLREAYDIGVVSGIVNDSKVYRAFDRICGHEGSYCNKLHLFSPDDLPKARKRMDTAAWDLLVEKSGMMAFLDSNAREEWKKAISDQKTVELTADNIHATFKEIFASRGDMFERGVIQCFRNLSWHYKTNKPQMFGKRIVIRLRSYGSIDYQLCDPISDLERVFAILDGKPQDDNRSDIYQRLRTAEDAGNGRRYSQFTHDDHYMAFRIFKNGNAHITFKRLDLIERMNRILAKHHEDALPAEIR